METIPSMIHPSWIPHIQPLFNLPEIQGFKDNILPTGRYYPEKHNIFRVFSMPLDRINVVILGQDPYPKKGQANGLAFAVNENVPIPYSLNIIKQELTNKYLNVSQYSHFNWRTLEHWHEQGVFLLNTALTVAPNSPKSHSHYWKNFIGHVIDIICEHAQPIWLIWGADAKTLAWEHIYAWHDKHSERKHGDPKNRTMTCGHPAAEYHNPGNGGFLGCNHFKKVNEVLTSINKQAINW